MTEKWAARRPALRDLGLTLLLGYLAANLTPLLRAQTASQSRETVAAHSTELSAGSPDTPDGTYTLPADKLFQARHLDRARNLLNLGSMLWGILVLFLVLSLRWATAIRDWAGTLTPRHWLQGFLFLPVLLLLLIAANLPFDVAGHHLSLLYGLSIQHWGSWFWDWSKSALLLTLGGTLALALLFAIVRRSPRRWWFWFWLISIPLEVLLIFILPVVVDPMFNRFEPLEKSNPELVAQIEQVVARSQLEIPPSRMFLMNASEKVTGLNAYVTGIGASKRVVVWDTTIQKAKPDEILFIYGHEQGHYVLDHIGKGLLFSSGVTLVVLLLGYRISNWLLRTNSNRWRISSLSDWAAVAVLLFIFSIFNLLAEPVVNAFSRVQEHHADIYGQEVIHGLVTNPRTTAAQSFQRLGEVWLEDPQPSPFFEFWFDSHPATFQRKAFAAKYDPWQPGRKPRYFAGAGPH